MTSSDYIKLDHLKVFVDKAVKPVCRALFMKRYNDLKPNEVESNAWTVERFLESNKDKILSDRAGRQKEWILFPSIPSHTNTDKWDSSLMCFLLIETCNLSKVLRTNLKMLKEYLDTIEEIRKSNVAEDKYEDYLAELKSIASICLSDIKDKELQKKIDEVSDHLEREKQTKKQNTIQDNEHRVVLKKRCGNSDESTEMIDGDRLETYNETLRNLLIRLQPSSQHVQEEKDSKQEDNEECFVDFKDSKQEDIEKSVTMELTKLKEQEEEMELDLEKETNKKLMDQPQDSVMLEKL
ncbi:uncharacterized protein LOC128548953 [Mercenaria mercenaria]|uniref:uncharacterized protein LOC128548953 n=1 Tax=Mercenaria mercenaria TaxID=6596 RepID=UPI00234F06A2|nr:uncharacterized protein LOC128548953 [Mercenaria mercenaria]